MIRSIIYWVAVICIVIWVLGFFGIGGMSTGKLLNTLLVLAIIGILYNIISGKKPLG